MRWLTLLAMAFLAFWVLGLVFKFIVSPIIHLALLVGLVLLVVGYFSNGRNRQAI